MVVARSGINDIGNVVKQLPVGTAQQGLTASSCMRTVVIEGHCGGGGVNIFRYTCDVLVPPCCVYSTLTTPFLFLPRKENSCHVKYSSNWVEFAKFNSRESYELNSVYVNDFVAIFAWLSVIRVATP
jgi:hypothetical protein